jgi:hypothetical protein
MPTFIVTATQSSAITNSYVFPSGLHPAYPTIPPTRLLGKGPIYVNAGAGVAF